MSDFMIDRQDEAVARRNARPKKGDRRLLPDFREALPAVELPCEVAANLKLARVDTAEPYELDDLPEIDEAPAGGSPRT